MTGNAYRDGQVHVLEQMCTTCVFRPGNLMGLPPGRLAGMIRTAEQDQSAITCHSTLYRPRVDNAVCRGFYDRHPTFPLRLAAATDLITFDPEPVEDRL